VNVGVTVRVTVSKPPMAEPFTQTNAVMGKVLPAEGTTKVALNVAEMVALAYCFELAEPHEFKESTMMARPVGLKFTKSTLKGSFARGESIML